MQVIGELILYRRRRFINHLLTYLLTHLLTYLLTYDVKDHIVTEYVDSLCAIFS